MVAPEAVITVAVRVVEPEAKAIIAVPVVPAQAMPAKTMTPEAVPPEAMSPETMTTEAAMAPAVTPVAHLLQPCKSITCCHSPFTQKVLHSVLRDSCRESLRPIAWACQIQTED